MSERLQVIPQYLMPKTLLTQLAGAAARHTGGGMTHAAIRRFVARYGVNMNEAANPSIESYASFNDFFTRELKAGARPLADADYVCPVDGAISQLGAIDQDRIFQAKGHQYTTTALVGGDADLARVFEGGEFACIYLSPKDYHRIHMPVQGQLTRMIYVPGELFSVNPLTARNVPGLFARNERVVCVFDTPHGPFINVLVGATIVGSMATVWHGMVNPPRMGQVSQWTYESAPVALAKGSEMGRFMLGSTVVMLWPKNTIRFNPAWVSGGAVQLGQAMGSVLK